MKKKYVKPKITYGRKGEDFYAGIVVIVAVYAWHFVG